MNSKRFMGDTVPTGFLLDMHANFSF